MLGATNGHTLIPSFLHRNPPPSPPTPHPQQLSPTKRRKRREDPRTKPYRATSTSSQTHRLSARTHQPKEPSAPLPPPSLPHALLDRSALVAAAKSCSSVRELKRLHAASLRLLQCSEVYVGNNLVSGYVRFEKIADARKMFDGMSRRDVVSWTTLLNGYSRLDLVREFLDSYSAMIASGVEPNCSTFVCVLDFCSRRSDSGLSRQIHAHIAKRTLTNVFLETALVHFYSELCDVVSASRIYDAVENPDVVCWTAMITACAQNGCAREAMSRFSRMQELDLLPNKFTVCSVLKVCGNEKALKLGRQLHAAVIKGMVGKDKHIDTSLVFMYTRCGEIGAAIAIFHGRPSRSTVTWTAMMAGYVRSGWGKQAISLFKKMRRLGIFANKLTIGSLIGACGIIGSSRHGKEVHGQILKSNIQNHSRIAKTLIWFYCKCGEHAYTARILESILRDVIAWTAMISGLANHGLSTEALLLLKKMMWEGVEPNPLTYSSALKACSQSHTMMLGRLIHASVSKACLLENVYVGSALITLYMRSGCTKDASLVFDMMPERNFVSWKAMVAGYAKNGLSEEALKFMYRMQAEGFEVDDYTMSTVLASMSGI